MVEVGDVLNRYLGNKQEKQTNKTFLQKVVESGQAPEKFVKQMEPIIRKQKGTETKQDNITLAKRQAISAEKLHYDKLAKPNGNGSKQFTIDLTSGLPFGWQLFPQFQFYDWLWGGKSVTTNGNGANIVDTPTTPSPNEVIIGPGFWGHTYDWGSAWTDREKKEATGSVPDWTQPGKPAADATQGLTDFFGSIPKYILYAGIGLAGVYLLGKFLGRK